MTDPADMIVPLLREMRAENLAQHEQTRAMIAALESKINKIKELEGHSEQAC